jgi:hypothetical protein
MKDLLSTNPDELVKLVDRAMKGDASTVPALRALLENPETVDLFCGNLARQVERSLIDAAAGKDLAFKEALQRKLELLRAELAGPKPSPLERLLADLAPDVGGAGGMANRGGKASGQGTI